MATLKELRKNPHWSFSALNTLVNMCALKWAFRYLYKKESERASVNLLFGSAFHAGSEFIARNRQKGECDKTVESQEVFSEYFNTGCKSTDNLNISSEEWNGLNSKGREMMQVLSDNWQERDVLGISRAFSINIDGLEKPLIGELDCIVRNDAGQVVVIDWKSAARKWPVGKEHKDMQATVFLLAYQRLANFIPKFRFDVITKTKTPTYNALETYRDQDDFDRLEYLLLEAQRLVQSGVFLPNSQCFLCGSCEYASSCKTWHKKNTRTIVNEKVA